MRGEPSVNVFDGVRVVEVAQWVFVPVAGALLADWGADVIKIEHPVTGDSYRGLMSQGMLSSASMELANRGKRSLGLDLKTPAGRDLLLRLVEESDVFLTNFMPPTLARLGLDVEDLRKVNPKIIYARGHGFGVRGPDADKPAYDASAFWARGGIGATLTPEGLDYPIGQRGAFGDRNGAVQLAFGISAALFRRERTGEPSIVDTSLLATAMWTLASDVIFALSGNFRPSVQPTPEARRANNNPASGTFRTKDGRFITLVLLQPDKYWDDLCIAIGKPELAADPRFVDMPTRAAHAAECVDILEEAFASRTYDEWREAFADQYFPWAPFQTVPELVEDRQVAANGYIGTLEIEGEEPLRLPTGAVQFDEQPAAIRRGPEHGQDTEDILLELGYDWDAIIKFKEAGVII